jgi:hypothetical protein
MGIPAARVSIKGDSPLRRRSAVSWARRSEAFTHELLDAGRLPEGDRVVGARGTRRDERRHARSQKGDWRRAPRRIRERCDGTNVFDRRRQRELAGIAAQTEAPVPDSDGNDVPVGQRVREQNLAVVARWTVLVSVPRFPRVAGQPEHLDVQWKREVTDDSNRGIGTGVVDDEDCARKRGL